MLHNALYVLSHCSVSSERIYVYITVCQKECYVYKSITFYNKTTVISLVSSVIPNHGILEFLKFKSQVLKLQWNAVKKATREGNGETSV